MSFWTARGRSCNQLYSTKVWYRHAIAYVLACQRFAHQHSCVPVRRSRPNPTPYPSHPHSSPHGTIHSHTPTYLPPQHPSLLPTPNAYRSTRHHPSPHTAPQRLPPSHQLEWAAVGGPGLLDHQVESLFGHQVLEFGQVLGDDRVSPQGGSQL